jgi:hypothetical protein
MMKRVTWFVTGVAAGAAGTGYAKRKVRRTAAQLASANVARSAAAKVRARSRDVADAVREGRSAMHDREHELKARRDARVELLDTRLEPDEELLVDGRPVDAGRVIVMKRRR